MDKDVLLAKTAKGFRESSGITRNLSRSLRSLLTEIDGKSTLADLMGRLPDWSESDLRSALGELISERYIHELIQKESDRAQIHPALYIRPTILSAASAPLDAGSLEDLDFTKATSSAEVRDQLARKEAEEKARREAEAKARRKAEERARREAEEKARIEAEERARKEAALYIRPTILSAASAPLDAGSLEDLDFTKATSSAEVRDQLARKEAEEKAHREAEAKARREAEERARREAEEKARIEAEERARKEAEEKARREAEEKARKEAEAKARREAEERARREAEEKARIEAEERARKEAEEKARREAEEKARKEAEAKARREAEERARREAEEKARIEAEERARKEAEEKARREAEEKARKEAEAKARREAEERARREAEEKARIEAEERARKEAEEKARREAEEKARKEAEAKARREAEERARREAEEKARIEAEERARKEAEQKSRQAAANMHTERRGREPIKWGKLVALGCVALIAMTIVAVNMMSFESRIPDFERAASAWFQQPVKIKTLRVAFLPHAQWQLEGVAIGNAGQILAPRITVPTSYAALFDKSNMTLASLQIDAPVIGTEGMGWLLFGRSQAPELHVRQVKATHIKLDIPGMRLPVFDATMDIGADGNWQKIGIVAMEKKAEMQLTAGNVVRLEMKLNQAALPFGALPVLDDLTAAGTLDRRALQLDEFDASLSGGSLRGRAGVVWGADAILSGQVTARGVDVGRLLAGFMESGRLEGKANFSLPIFSDGKTAAAVRLTGDFAIDRGTLATVDFGRMVKGESGGRTKFEKLTGRATHRGGETQLRELFLDAGKLTANGSADLDARRDIRGQFLVSLNLGATRQRVSIALSGPFKTPYKDLKWQ